jgi:hypothetical protein
MRFLLSKDDSGCQDHEANFEIDNLNRVYKLGRNIDGRICRVGHHPSILIKMKIGESIRTCGKTYTRLS